MNGLFRQRHPYLMSNTGYFVLAFLLLFAAVSPRAAVPPTAGQAPAAALKRDTELCSARANIDACYDAIRWSPNDPALLVSLGDALVRAKRPQDAVRSYRRAAALAPGPKSTSPSASYSTACAHGPMSSSWSGACCAIPR